MGKLSDNLISVGKMLSEASIDEKIHLGRLKELKYSGLAPYISKSYDSETRFFAFFLTNFLDDVFYNLIGDVPYGVPYGESVHSIIKEFFIELGKKLCNIGEALSKKNFVQINECFNDMVVDYLDRIEKINNTIKYLI